jgi:hypothetical protein
MSSPHYGELVVIPVTIGSHVSLTRVLYFPINLRRVLIDFIWETTMPSECILTVAAFNDYARPAIRHARPILVMTRTRIKPVDV